VDVPNIDCVLFADPKRSTIDIVQAVGRALRPFEGKKFGYVLVPRLLDRKITNGKTYEQQAYENVLMVLRAMASNDERIIEYFRAVSQGRKPTVGKDLFTVDIPEGLKIDAASFVRSVELKLWSRLAKLSWRPFDEAREFVHKLDLKGQTEWEMYRKGDLLEKGTLPEDIPTNPNRTYENQGWKGFGDWLGTGTIAHQLREFRPFKEARAFVRNLGLRGQDDWKKYCRRDLLEKGQLPPDIPTAPHMVYKDQDWANWGDWLGTGTVANQLRDYRPFKEARKFVRSLGLRGHAEWRKYCKDLRPDDIPVTPELIYENDWRDWGDWLGTGTVAPQLRKFRPFRSARKFARSLGLKGNSEWRRYCREDLLKKKGRRPPDIPTNPNVRYRGKGWKGYRDWLSTENRK